MVRPVARSEDVDNALQLVFEHVRNSAEQNEPYGAELLEIWDDAISSVLTAELVRLPGLLRGAVSVQQEKRGQSRESKQLAATLLDSCLRQVAASLPELIAKRSGTLGGVPASVRIERTKLAEPPLELAGATGFFVTVSTQPGVCLKARKEFSMLVEKLSPSLALTSAITSTGIVFLAEGSEKCSHVSEVLAGATKEDRQGLRYCERILPMQLICKDDLDEVTNAVRTLSQPLLSEHREPTTFAVRSEGGALRGVSGGLTAGMAKLADAIPDCHEVDLKDPKIVVQLRGISYAGSRWCGVCVAQAGERLCLRSEQEFSQASAGYSYYDEDVNSSHVSTSKPDGVCIPTSDAELACWESRLRTALREAEAQGDGVAVLQVVDSVAEASASSKGAKARMKRTAREAQAQALLQSFEDGKLLRDADATIEFGAGKGELTELVRKRLLCKRDAVVSCLVDRDVKLPTWVGKKDCWEASSGIHCLRIDIRNLNLHGISQLLDRRSIGIGKHVCGAATDLAIRCLCGAGAKPPGDEGVPVPAPEVVGVGIALCCRHACNWQDYVNQSWVLNAGFTAEDFSTMTHMSTWAHQPDPRRQQLGKLCKSFIDTGRARYLQDNGFKTVLREYVPAELTQENLMLLAVKEASEEKHIDGSSS